MTWHKLVTRTTYHRPEIQSQGEVSSRYITTVVKPLDLTPHMCGRYPDTQAEVRLTPDWQLILPNALKFSGKKFYPFENENECLLVYSD